MTDFQLVPFSTQHIQESYHLFNKCFGKGYLKIDGLTKLIAEKGFFGCVVLYKNIELIGACIGNTDAMFINDKAIYLKSIAVKDEYKNKGVGKMLLKSFIKAADDKQLTIYSSVWIKRDKNIFENMLAKNGFNLHEKYENYWREASIKEQFECKYCGIPPCLCSMKIYFRLSNQ